MKTGVFVVAGLALVGLAILIWRGSDDFRARRARYEAIVSRVGEALPAGRSAKASFLISEDKDPASLRTLDFSKPADAAWLSRSTETRIVEGERISDGRLTVRICTWSWGHAGVGGLFYSSGPPGPREADDAFGWGQARRLDEHWWSVEDYSQ
jgi:hypothetical protein